MVDAFDNDQSVCPQQDIGFDGLTNDEERSRKAQFLTNVQATVNQSAFDRLQADPSTDDYTFFKDENVYANVGGVIARYKNFTGVEGNSP